MHCNFAGDECWRVRTHPTITGVNTNTGWNTGSQKVEVWGYGFRQAVFLVHYDDKDWEDFSNFDVTIGGEPCIVEEVGTIVKDGFDQEYFVCDTSATVETPAAHDQPGPYGLTWNKYSDPDEDVNPGYTDITQGQAPLDTQLFTSFETLPNYSLNRLTWDEDTYRFAQDLDGWFVPPQTGNYRFYMSCDDSCRLYLDSTNAYSSGVAAAPTQIAWNYNAKDWRHYFHSASSYDAGTNQVVSDWIALTGGESYKIYAESLQYGGNEHLTVSVEFEQADASAHPLGGSEIQQLTVTQDPDIPEEWTWTITSPDGGFYRLAFLVPIFDADGNVVGQESKTTDNISDKASANAFRSAIYWKVYRTKFSAWVEVTRVMLDAGNVETADESLAVTITYTVVVEKRINHDVTPTKISAYLATTTTATGVFSLVNKSTLPLSGYFKIRCNDGISDFDTPPMLYSHWREGVQNNLSNYIPFVADKVSVMEGYTCKHQYRQNCISLVLNFHGVTGDVAQCQLMPIEAADMLNGETELVGDPLSTLVIDNATIRQGGANLMFEPVPLEMIRENSQTPFIDAKISGLQALCKNRNCGFTYVAPTAEITGASYDAGTRTITIDGTGLATSVDQIREIVLQRVPCLQITTVSDTQTTCVLEYAPPAGSHPVQYRMLEGQVPINGAPNIEISLIITGLSPNVQLNNLGGTLLTLIGTGFNTHEGIDRTQTTLTFADGTDCMLEYSSPEMIQCITCAFKTDNFVDPLPLTVWVNDFTDESASTTVDGENVFTSGLSPNSVSPVLKQNIQVSLPADYPGTIVAENFYVFSENLADHHDLKQFHVVSADATAKTLTLKYPGLLSGDYVIKVDSLELDIGKLKPSTEPGQETYLTVESRVTAIDIRTGSSEGGTVLTIDGVNFSDEPTDNPVKVGNNWCIVGFSSATRIICQIEVKSHVAGPAEVIVFLKTSEEAICDTGSDCLFTFETPSEVVTGVSVAYDTVNLRHVATVTGSGFTDGDTANTYLVIDGFTQSTLTVTPTEATFEVTEIYSTESDWFHVLFAAGYPIVDAGVPTLLTFTPTFVSLHPNNEDVTNGITAPSAGGTKFTVVGSGFGQGDVEDLDS